jgi:hypothetical protein
MFFLISLDSDKKAFFIYLVFASFVSLWVVRYINQRKLRMMLKLDPSAGDEIFVSTTDDGIKVATSSSESHIQRQAIRNVEIDDRYLFVEFRMLSIMAIPLTAFHGESDVKLFKNHLLSK